MAREERRVSLHSVFIKGGKGANKKWLSIPEDFRKKLIGNVFCSNCKDAVTITDFVILDHSAGVMLDGKCKNCGNKVVRVVEDD